MTKSVSKTKVLLSKIALLPSLLVFFICAESMAKNKNNANENSFTTQNTDLGKSKPSQKNENSIEKLSPITMHYSYSRKIIIKEALIQDLMNNLGAYITTIYKTPEGVKREKEFAKFTFLLDNNGNISDIKIFEEEGSETEATLLRILQSRPKVALEKKSGEANWDPIAIQLDFWPKNPVDQTDKPIRVIYGVFGLPETTPSQFVDIAPKYIGNRDNLNKDIATKNLGRKNFPKGKLAIGFVVETDGSLSNFTLISEINSEAFNEVVKVLKDTKWEPGEKDGKVLRTSYELKVPVSAVN